MFHKSSGCGQPNQWLRICASCEYIFIERSNKPCPKCGFAHYGAPMVYDGFFTALFYFVLQFFKNF